MKPERGVLIVELINGPWDGTRLSSDDGRRRHGNADTLLVPGGGDVAETELRLHVRAGGKLEVTSSSRLRVNNDDASASVEVTTGDIVRVGRTELIVLEASIRRET